MTQKYIYTFIHQTITNIKVQVIAASLEKAKVDLYFGGGQENYDYWKLESEEPYIDMTVSKIDFKREE